MLQVSGYVDPQRRSPDQLLRDWPTLSLVATAAERAGCRVTVIQAAAHDATLEQDDVRYHFVRAASTRASAAAVARAAHGAQPDVLHVHGLSFPLHVRALRHALPDTPLLLQDHANAPPRGWRAIIARRLMRSVDAVAVTSAEQLEPFTAVGLFRNVRVFEIAESTSSFTTGDRAAAHASLGVHGSPSVVWIGRLAAVKDPLTALAAFRGALDTLPDARLWCAFSDAPLLAEVEQMIAQDDRLANTVVLLGRLNHDDIQDLLRAADIFLAASRREGSGYALIEALACGAVPAVTSIPAFRALTGGGRVGALFPPGDVTAGAAAIVSAARSGDQRAAVRAHFDELCSPDAIGRQLATAYAELHANVSIGAVVPRRTRLRGAGYAEVHAHPAHEPPGESQ